MISIGMIFTALATTTLATAALAEGSTECNFSEPTGVQLCFGAVGQLLIFHLTNTANTDIRLKKDDKYIILNTKKQIVTRHADYVNLRDLFTNGTIKLGNAMKSHSGDYLLEEYRSNGTLLKKVNVHLEIQAPVSKPAVSQMCLSPEQMNISCSSEGDGVEFNWTLNGVLLVPTRGYSQFPSNMTENIESPTGDQTERDKPSVSNVTISFLGQQTGNLMCGVWNNVSRDETVFHLAGCKAPVSKPAVSQMCLSPEQMNIRCSSEGDGVKFNWTLNGVLLVPTRGYSQFPSNMTANIESLTGKKTERDKPSVSYVTISFLGQQTGNVTCHVWNNVSRDETVIHLTGCKAFFSHSPVVVAVRASVITLLLLALCLGICHVHKKTRPTAVNEVRVMFLHSEAEA